MYWPYLTIMQGGVGLGFGLMGKLGLGWVLVVVTGGGGQVGFVGRFIQIFLSKIYVTYFTLLFMKK